VSCRPKARKCDRATSSLTQITWIEVKQKLRGHIAPGCKWYSQKCNIQCQWWVYDSLDRIIDCKRAVSMWLMWETIEHQWFFVLHIRQSKGYIVTSLQSECIGLRYSVNRKWHSLWPIWTMSVNWALTILDLVSWKIQELYGNFNSRSNYQLPT